MFKAVPLSPGAREQLFGSNELIHVTRKTVYNWNMLQQVLRGAQTLMKNLQYTELYHSTIAPFLPY